MDENKRKRKSDRPNSNSNRSNKTRNRNNSKLNKGSRNKNTKKGINQVPPKSELNEENEPSTFLDFLRKNTKVALGIVVALLLIVVVFIYGLNANQKDSDIDSIIKTSEKDNEKIKKEEQKNTVNIVGFNVPLKSEYTSEYIETLNDDERMYLEVLDNLNLLIDQDNSLEKAFKQNAQRNILRYMEIVDFDNGYTSKDILKKLNTSKYTLIDTFQNTWEGVYRLENYTTVDLGYKKIDEGIYIGYPLIDVDVDSDKQAILQMSLLLVEDIKEKELNKIIKDRIPKLDSIVLRTFEETGDNKIVKSLKDSTKDNYVCVTEGLLLNNDCYPDVDFQKVISENKDDFIDVSVLYEAIGMDISKVYDEYDKATEDDKITFPFSKYGTSISYPINKGDIISGGTVYDINFIIPELDRNKNELTLTLGGESFRIYKENPVEQGTVEKYVEW